MSKFFDPSKIYIPSNFKADEVVLKSLHEYNLDTLLINIKWEKKSFAERKYLYFTDYFEDEKKKNITIGKMEPTGRKLNR